MKKGKVMKRRFLVKIVLMIIAVLLSLSCLSACVFTKSSTDDPTTPTGTEQTNETGDTGDTGDTDPPVPAFEPSSLTAEQVNGFDERYVNLYGRTYKQGNTLVLDHAATAIEFGIFGQSFNAEIEGTSTLYICIYVDDVFKSRVEIRGGTNTYPSIIRGLQKGYHKIRIVKSSESTDGQVGIVSLDAIEFATVPEKSKLKIEYIGDSITAGYGIRGTDPNQPRTVENSDATMTYAYVSAAELNADYSIVAVSGICVRAQMWLTRSMDDVYKKTSWANNTAYSFGFNADVVILNLGGNETEYLKSKSAAYAEQFPTDYYNFLEFIRDMNPNAYIICMYGMMGADPRITNGIETAVGEMDDEKVVFYKDYGVDTSAANGHPSAEAQRTWGLSLAEYISQLNI